MIEVYPVGATVDLGGTLAMITGIMIRGKGHVIYECTWWNGHDRKECWVQSGEIRCMTDGHEKIKIGFAT